MTISDIDAEKDNIKTTFVAGSIRSYNAYHIICENCGNEYIKRRYRSDAEHLCDRCKYYKNKTIKAKQRLLDTLQEVRTNKEIRFDKAIDEMKSQLKWNKRYEHCASIAKKRVENYGSIPEAMVAIELLYLGYSITPQQKISKYRVDFLIGSIKTVIEVDGNIFHAKPKDNREAVIQLSLGLDWDIIHIPAELIRKDIKKLELILQHRGKK